MTIKTFNIDIPDESLNDLSTRLKNTRWPKGKDSSHWKYGTNTDYLKNFVDYWINEYDWRAQEKLLNRLPHFKSEIDGVDIHFIHVKGKGENPIPIILSHGWPDSFMRYLKVIPYLTDPVRFGRNSNDSFDVVIPSIPGFGFSALPDSKTVNNADVADLWKHLMTDELGYNKFGALGGDMGSGITRYMAHKYPDHLIAIHLTDVGIIRDIVFAENNENLTSDEIQYKQAALQWIAQEGGYMSIQSTKPRTLGYGLSDSPVGLAAWILEKFYTWGDCNGDLKNRFSINELITNIMIYWLNNSIGTSNHIYYENTHSLPKLGKITVPTGLALFAKDVLPPPGKWVENNLNLVQWTEIPEGGHFTAMEAPDLFADDVLKFFRNFRTEN